MRSPRLTVERIEAIAFKLAVIATVATILTLCVGGFHYLSTTNNFTRTGSFAVLGLIRYPFYTAIVTFAVGVGCHLWIEWSVKRTRQATQDDDSSTLDVIDDWNKRY